jgi:hypothetical protein
VASFLAYDPAFRGGVYVATAGAGKYAVSSDGSQYIGPAAKVVTGTGAGASPVAKVFDGAGREYFAHPVGDASDGNGLRVTGGTYGYLYETAGRVGFNGYGEGGGGWAIPPGASRVTGVIAAVDLAAGTLTIRTYRADVRVVPLRADAVVNRQSGRAALASVRVGDWAEAILGADGVAAEISTLPPSPAVAVPVA